MRLTQLYLLIIAATSLSFGTYKLNDINDPRPNSWILDKKQYLSVNTAMAIENLCKEVRNSNHGEIMVVIVDRIGNNNHRQFATAIFNKFGIGNSQSHDGILIYAALEQRAAEIILGDGIDNDVIVTISDRIMNSTMIPRFKADNNEDAIFYGTLECAKQILKVTSKTIKENNGNSDTVTKIISETDLSLHDNQVSETNRPLPYNHALETDNPPYANQTESNNNPYSTISLSNEIVTNESTFFEKIGYFILYNPVLSGIYAALTFIMFFLLKAAARHLPKKCPECKLKMERLDELSDNDRLIDGEFVEEDIRSVDYDIWRCPQCDYIKKIKYVNWFRSYSKCPECNYRTLKKTTSTITPASTYSSGKEQVDHDCKNCSYHNSYIRTIPRQSSSSGYSSSSGSSRSSGGRSSGGGSSGRW